MKAAKSHPQSVQNAMFNRIQGRGRGTTFTLLWRTKKSPLRVDLGGRCQSWYLRTLKLRRVVIQCPSPPCLLFEVDRETVNALVAQNETVGVYSDKMAGEVGVDGRVAPVTILIVRGDDFSEGDVHTEIKSL